MKPSLLELSVLVVDCQTTGGSPRTGHLLDLGWCVHRAADPPPDPGSIRHHIARLPPGAGIPRPVIRLTGLTAAHARTGRSRGDLWRDLGEDAAALRNGTGAFCVAHYARFEEGFLRALHAECAPADPFPLRFLCTHEICRRLFPALPRRGLRAMAGHFGSAAPELKRAREHVAATAALWSGLARRLRDEHGVETLDDLRRLLSEPPLPRRGRWEYPLAREKRLALPDRPGVYRFLGGDGTVLYVGKARSLRARVNSYFRQRRPGDKVLELVSQAMDVQVTVTASALEAALVEAAEIQRLAPRYNQALRVEDPRVWFFSTDFARARPEPGRAHRRGPYPDRRPFAVLRALASLLTGERPRGEAERALIRALDLPGRRGAGVIAAGADRLAGRHRLDGEGAGVTGLLALGRRLARDRAAARAEPAAAAAIAPDPAAASGAVGPGGSNGPGLGEDGRTAAAGPAAIPGGLFAPDEPARGPGPTPEGMADWLESTLVHAVRLVRRAWWFALLADSTLCWRPGGAGAARLGPRRVLVVEGGRISMSDNVLPGEIAPLPATGARPRPTGCDAHNSFTYNVLNGEIGLGPAIRPHRRSPREPDRADYDRLRVLTTEIRRLLAEGREVELHLPPRRPGGRSRCLGTRLLRRVMERL